VLRCAATLCLMVTSLIVPWLFTLELVYEVRFLLLPGVPLSWVPLYIYSRVNPPEAAAEEPREMPCDRLSANLIRSANFPILFKACLPDAKEVSIDKDFPIFRTSVQTVFTPCKSNGVIRKQFETLNGDVSEVSEIVPCELTTLEEKIRAMKNHSTHDSSLSEAHVFWLNSTTTDILDEHLHNIGFIPQAYNVKDTGAICSVGFFLSAGSKTNVDYLHSHMDQFLSFGLEKSKVWELIHPLHVDKFETTWSGQSLVMTKQKERVPVITLNQEPGDVLFVPPWWMHKTSRKNDMYARHASMNVHCLTTRSLSAFGALALFSLGMERIMELPF